MLWNNNLPADPTLSPTGFSTSLPNTGSRPLLPLCPVLAGLADVLLIPDPAQLVCDFLKYHRSAVLMHSCKSIASSVTLCRTVPRAFSDSSDWEDYIQHSSVSQSSVPGEEDAPNSAVSQTDSFEMPQSASRFSLDPDYATCSPLRLGLLSQPCVRPPREGLMCMWPRMPRYFFLQRCFQLQTEDMPVRGPILHVDLSMPSRSQSPGSLCSERHDPLTILNELNSAQRAALCGFLSTSGSSPEPSTVRH